MVDPEKLDPAHTTSVVLSSVSHDGSLLLYGLRHGGEDEITPHLYDVNAHRETRDSVARPLLGNGSAAGQDCLLLHQAHN